MQQARCRVSGNSAISCKIGLKQRTHTISPVLEKIRAVPTRPSKEAGHGWRDPSSRELRRHIPGMMVVPGKISYLIQHDVMMD
jgi:hypothetical protein